MALLGLVIHQLDVFVNANKVNDFLLTPVKQTQQELVRIILVAFRSRDLKVKLKTLAA